MNIALLTFSQAFSYGAMLQCYALSKILTDAGHRVFLVRSDLKAKIQKNNPMAELQYENSKPDRFRQYKDQ